MSNWKQVNNAKNNKAGTRMIERALTSDRFPDGFRTFETLEQVFTIVLLKKLKNEYRDVQFHVQTTVGDKSKTGHTFKFVVITMVGPARSVDSAYDDAETFLNTGHQDPERYLEAQWRVPAEVDTPIQRMAEHARVAADQLGISINWSHGKSCFFIIKVLLKRELRELREKNVSRTRMVNDMVQQATAFLLSATGNHFRQAPSAAPPGRGGYGAGRGAGGRGGGRGGRGGTEFASGFFPNMSQQLKAIGQLPPLEAKHQLRLLFDDMQQNRPSDILAWLSVCYEIDKSYLQATHAALETVDMDISIDNTYTNIAKLEVRPEMGYMPFTQRYPKIRADDTLHVRFPAGAVIDLKVYAVHEYAILVHLGEDEKCEEAVTRAIRLNEKVAMTVNPGSLIGMLSALQRCLTYHDTFERIRGTGQYHHGKKNPEEEMHNMRHSEQFRTAAPQEQAPQEQESAPRGRGRGRGAGQRQERGGRGRGGGGGASSMPNTQDEDDGGRQLLDGLYAEQLLAAHCILNKRSPRIYIDGPGGTGKTETLVRSIALLRKRDPNAKILVVTPTVMAGDVIATRLLELFQRYGMEEAERAHWKRLYGSRFHPLYCNPVLYPFSNAPCDDEMTMLKFNELGHTNRFRHEGDYFEEVMHDVNLVICGTSTARKLSSEWLNEVSYIFLDEAGCTPLAEAMGTLRFISEKATLVMSGDPQQLLPRSYCPFTKQSLQTNPLQYFDTALKIKLRVSHRSSAGLVHVQSMLFYNGELHAARQTATGTDDVEETCYPRWSGHNGRPNVVRILHNDGPESRTNSSAAAVSSQTTANTNDLVNKTEVDIVFTAVLSLCEECSVRPEDIGIVCEYPEQIRRIKQRLNQSGKRGARVCNIDDFQGHERDIMIAAMTRSTYDPKDPDAIDLHKLCTILTRACHLSLIVGNVPVYLQRDAHKNKKRASKGRWTELVEMCREKGAVDHIDDKGEFVGVTPFKVATKVAIKETVKRGEDEGKRKMVSVTEVRAHPQEFFIGVVASREGGQLRIRNRWKSAHDVAIDEHVASGLRSYAVFPGDIVAVLIDHEVLRWQDAHDRADPPQTCSFPRTAGGTPRLPPPTFPWDFRDSFDVTISVPAAAAGQVRPVGAVACVLHRTAVVPQEVFGTVEGNYFVPEDDLRYPQLEVHEAARANPTPGQQYKACVVVGNDGPRYAINAKPTPVPVAVHGLLPREHESLVEDVDEGMFVALSPEARISRQHLASVTYQGQVAPSYSRVSFTVLAPAVGPLACQVGNAESETIARDGWSEWLQKQRRTNGSAFPDTAVDSDGFKLPRPQGGFTAMIGVSFTLEYFDQPYPAVLPDNYSGPKLVGEPEVARFRRLHNKLPGPDTDFTNLANVALRSNRRTAATAMFDENSWIADLLHWANHAAARVLLRKMPSHSLLLRQTLAPTPIDGPEETVFDAPEWYVASTLTDDTLLWELPAMHAAADRAPYTSFTHAHHSYGDMLVQHLLLFASGFNAQNRDALLNALRSEASRLNTLMLLVRP